ASRLAWQLFAHWMSEILADFWALGKVGLVSTLGLMSTLTLPARFVFRFNPDDPHPIPWLRVLLSSALGHALYPHPQWNELAECWRAYYPVRRAEPGIATLLSTLENELDGFVAFLLEHRPRTFAGLSLGEALRLPDRDARQLGQAMRAWRSDP